MKNKFLLIISLFSFTFLQAQDVKDDFKTSSVSIFKNGSAFYLKTGNLKTKDGIYRMTKNIPAALFGTLWINSKDDDLKYVSSFTDKVVGEQKLQAVSFTQMLNANIGKKMILHIGKDEQVEGNVETVESLNNKNQEDFNNNGTPIRHISKSIVTFKTTKNWLTFSIAEIRRIEFLEKPNQIIYSKTTQQKPIVQLDFKSKKENQAIDMMYLSNGLSWIPNYLIELTSDEKATLTLRAEVANNAEEIKNTEVNFVVGVPNFKYANRLSSLVDFLKTANRNNQNEFLNFSNSLSQSQSITYGIEANSNGFADVDLSAGVEGSSQEDLFFYTLKNISLKKEGRGHFQIFNTDIDIEHIYECNLPQNTTNKHSYQENFLFTPDTQNKVFHSIKLNNKTNFPWTTGSAMVVKVDGETKPISQDQLNYTPINGSSFVKLTQAPDVKIKHAEKSIKIEDKNKKEVKNKKTYYYDLVTVEGQLKVKNYKNKKIDLNIRRAILGELKNSSVDWLKSERINSNGQLNNTTDVCWETSIKSGEELVIKYTYKIYVPD